jgi:hypothetical protein
MNVLKLLRVFWKHKINRNEFKAVNYYVLYERVNHTSNPMYQYYGEHRYIDKHEDDIDKMIFDNLYQRLNENPDIQQLNIFTHEVVLHPDFEELNRAIFSNMAFGWDFNNLQINTNDQVIEMLATRIMFHNTDHSEAILMSIPETLNLNLNGKIPSLVRTSFLEKEITEQILKREEENGFDYKV